MSLVWVRSNYLIIIILLLLLLPCLLSCFSRYAHHHYITHEYHTHTRETMDNTLARTTERAHALIHTFKSRSSWTGKWCCSTQSRWPCTGTCIIQVHCTRANIPMRSKQSHPASQTNTQKKRANQCQLIKRKKQVVQRHQSKQSK